MNEPVRAPVLTSNRSLSLFSSQRNRKLRQAQIQKEAEERRAKQAELNAMDVLGAGEGDPDELDDLRSQRAARAENLRAVAGGR